MDIDRYLRDRYTPRTAFIPIPEIKEYFTEEDFKLFESMNFTEKTESKVEIVKGTGIGVRSLTGDEYSRIQSDARQELHRVAVELLAANSQDMAKSIREYLGIQASPENVEKLLCIFENGMIYPEVKPGKKIHFAAKLNREFPIDFLRVTNKIQGLTSAGQVLVLG